MLIKFLPKHLISLTCAVFLARPDIKTGDNWHPDPKLVEQMLSTSSSPDGSLSLEDYAQYRVIREKTLPEPFHGARSLLATGEIGLILPSIGRDSSVVVQVSSRYAKLTKHPFIVVLIVE